MAQVPDEGETRTAAAAKQGNRGARVREGRRKKRGSEKEQRGEREGQEEGGKRDRSGHSKADRAVRPGGGEAGGDGKGRRKASETPREELG